MVKADSCTHVYEHSYSILQNVSYLLNYDWSEVYNVSAFAVVSLSADI